MVDILTYLIKVLIDLVVRDPDNNKISGFDFLCSDFIVKLSFVAVMLRAVKLDYQSGTVTVKVNNIIVNYFLPQKANRVIF